MLYNHLRHSYVLDGYKALVHNASASDTLIVSARTSGNQCDEKGISLFLVDANAKGVSLRNYSTIDGGKASELTLENVTVSKDSLLGDCLLYTSPSPRD